VRSSTVPGAVLLYSAGGRSIVAGELATSSGVRTSRRALQYRAPYGRLIALLDSPAARPAGERLGVPVLPKRDDAGRPAFERFAREHGEELEGTGTRRPPEAATAALTSSPAMRPRPGPVTGRPIVRAIARQRGAWHVALVLGLALGLTLAAAGRLSWLVLRPTLRVSWWLTWWGLRVAVAVVVFCVLLTFSFLGLDSGRRS